MPSLASAGRSNGAVKSFLSSTADAAARVGLSPVGSRRIGCCHGRGSHALDRGALIHLVQATLGHASVATTEPASAPATE